MRKVLHLTTHLNSGGITTYILRLTEPLFEKGFHCFVASSGGEYEDLFDAEGVQTFKLNIQVKNEFHPKVFLSLPGLLRILKKNRIDLIHAHTRVSQVLAALASRLTGIPVVTTCHGFYKRRLGRRVFPAWGNAAVAISPAVEDHLKKDFLLPDEKIRLIYNAVDLQELTAHVQEHSSASAKTEYGIPAESPVLGIIARLVKEKGHEYLLKAAAALIPDCPELRVLVIGEGRDRERLENLCLSLGIAGHVIFTGNLIEISQALAAMDVFVLPAVWKEAFGLSIIEAAACGKPVVVTKQSALAGVIEEYGAGLTVPPQDAGQLAEAVRKLLSDDSLRTQVGEGGRRMVEEKFMACRMGAEMAGLYNDILTSGKS